MNYNFHQNLLKNGKKLKIKKIKIKALRFTSKYCIDTTDPHHLRPQNK
jgi:hypothetical protein